MTINKLMEGLQIIAKTQPKALVDSHHEALYVGRYNPKEMDPADVKRLEKLGWHMSEDSWAHFT